MDTLEEFRLARVLEECLEEMEKGERDLDRLTGRHPDSRHEIRPLLEIAQELRRHGSLGASMSLQFREELRARLLSHHSLA